MPTTTITNKQIPCRQPDIYWYCLWLHSFFAPPNCLCVPASALFFGQFRIIINIFPNHRHRGREGYPGRVFLERAASQRQYKCRYSLISGPPVHNKQNIWMFFEHWLKCYLIFRTEHYVNTILGRDQIAGIPSTELSPAIMLRQAIEQHSTIAFNFAWLFNQMKYFRFYLIDLFRGRGRENKRYKKK